MTTTNANTEPTHVSNILAVFMQQLVAKQTKASNREKMLAQKFIHL